MFRGAFLKSPILQTGPSFLVNRFLSTERALSELGKKSLIFNESDGYVMKSPFGSVSIPDVTIDQYVWKDLTKWQNHIAIQCGSTGRKYTYAKLRDHCAALAVRLRTKLKLEKNDIIGICMPNAPEYGIAFLGSVEAGLVITTINTAYTSAEISRQLLSCQPKAIICSDENYEIVKTACSLAQMTDIQLIAIKTSANVPNTSGSISFTELIDTNGLNLSEASEFNKNVDLDSITLLPYSSGTTGLPKGVMLSHRQLVANCESIDVPLPNERLVSPTTNDFQEILPCFLPFFHIYGLMVLLVPKLALGTKLITMPKYSLEHLLEVITEHKATFLNIVPPVVVQMNNSKACKPKVFDSIRSVMSGASNIAQSDGEKFQKLFNNATFFQGYGLTETSPVCTITPQGLKNYGTIGWPVPNVEMKIVSLDESNSKGLAANETGELWVRGTNVMSGYYKNDEATKITITEDKWLRTGDIGHFDGAGLFYISDRLKELIKVNANQVAPAELEAILRSHPDITDAVVVGVPHEKFGEVPKAFVVRRSETKVTEQDIKEFVANQVAKFKQLSGGVEFITNIPKTPTGKILRREFRKTSK